MTKINSKLYSLTPLIDKNRNADCNDGYDLVNILIISIFIFQTTLSFMVPED